MTYLLPKRRQTIPGPETGDFNHRSEKKDRANSKDSGNLKNGGSIKNFLDRLYRETNKPEFIPLDPVQFPHRYKNKKDIEVAVFLAATIAWGRRDLILKSCEKMFTLMGKSPYDFVMKGDYPKLPASQAIAGGRGFCIHRTFFQDDFLYLCRGLRNCYAKYTSLENLFVSAPDVWEGISLFRETIAAGNNGASAASPIQPSYSKHISSPESGSACKRLHLALRWLARQEGPVDLGIWKKISPASLFIPLDLHVGRSARELGLLENSRQANDKKAVISLTEKLRAFCREDPVKYDFALFGYSADSK